MTDKEHYDNIAKAKADLHRAVSVATSSGLDVSFLIKEWQGNQYLEFNVSRAIY